MRELAKKALADLTSFQRKIESGNFDSIPNIPIIANYTIAARLKWDSPSAIANYYGHLLTESDTTDALLAVLIAGTRAARQKLAAQWGLDVQP